MKKSPVVIVLFGLSIVWSTPKLRAQVITFAGSELLGRPSHNSMTVNIVPNAAIELCHEYGTTPSASSPFLAANEA